MEKCKFNKETISFLGYVIDTTIVSIDNKKVETVQNWPTPQILKELQRCLCFANFYCRFIKNYNIVAAPLIPLTKEGKKKISWNSEADAAFKKLKEAFTIAPY